MIRRGNDIYMYCETGEWLLCGKIIRGADGDFIRYFV